VTTLGQQFGALGSAGAMRSFDRHFGGSGSRLCDPFLVTLLAGLLLALSAQQGAPTGNTTGIPKGGYKFEANVQLVIVNVSAKDKNGKPLEGLKASDFTVTEDGKAQKVSVFEFQRLEQTPEPAPVEAPPALQQRIQAADLPAGVKAVVKTEIAPSKPGEVKYKGPPPPGDVLRPDRHAHPDQIRAQASAQKFLKTQMTPRT